MGTELVDTRHGPMWIIQDDPGCSRIIAEYGEYSEAELAFLKLYLKPTDVALDAGAHLGAFTIPMARLCKKVYAVEPQEEVREILTRNLELNSITNVEILPYALGETQRDGYCSIDHVAWTHSYGSVEVEVEPFVGAEMVKVVSLDSLDLPITFIKSDVEGMELHLLAGAQQSLAANRPYVFQERNCTPETYAIVMQALNYYYAPLDFPIFTPNNWNNNPVDHYVHRAHQMMLMIPNA